MVEVIYQGVETDRKTKLENKLEIVYSEYNKKQIGNRNKTEAQERSSIEREWLDLLLGEPSGDIKS